YHEILAQFAARKSAIEEGLNLLCGLRHALTEYNTSMSAASPLSPLPPLDPQQLAGAIPHAARRLGFDLAGIAGAEPSRHGDFFRQWLDAGKHGDMAWLARRFDERTDPAV